MLVLYELGAFILFGLIAFVAQTVVKMDVNSSIPESERFSWLSRYTSKVGRRHRELFPGSPLPAVAQLSYWICLLILAAMFVQGLLQR